MIKSIFRIEGVLDGHVYNSGLPKSKLPLEKVHPLPLEAHHLEKFGFLPGEKEHGEDEDTYAYKYNRKDSVYLREVSGGFQPLAWSSGGLVAYGRPLVHLHQLQNLFYDLTREDVFIM